MKKINFLKTEISIGKQETTTVIDRIDKIIPFQTNNQISE